MLTNMSDSRPSLPADLTPVQQRLLALAQDQTSEVLAPVLAQLRQQGAEDFVRAAWPGRKHEHWKYTPIRALEAVAEGYWAQKVVQGDAASNQRLAEQLIPVQATRLVFIDGELNTELSDPLPEGVTLFSQALAQQQAKPQAATVLENHLGKIAGSVDAERRNLFASLNNAWTRDGLLIHVPRNVALSTPLYLVYIASKQDAAAVAHQRSLIVLEQGASAQVIEHFLSEDNTAASGFVNALTEIQLNANAQLSHVRLNLEHEASAHVGGVHVNLMRDAHFKGFALAEGSRLKRIDYQLNHCGQGASLKFDGVYLARHEQLVDYHTCIEHRVPHCTSEQVFRGIVGDRAKAVFNGRIHIFEDAQKTLAEMSNRNLLTSSQAEINTKPELEIYADDVKCAHGATISQLDETALYYLQSRGISAAQARTLLSFGFVNELLYGLPSESLQTWLEAWLQQRFTEDRSLISGAGA